MHEHPIPPQWLPEVSVRAGSRLHANTCTLPAKRKSSMFSTRCRRFPWAPTTVSVRGQTELLAPALHLGHNGTAGQLGLHPSNLHRLIRTFGRKTVLKN